MGASERIVWVIDENYAGFALIRKFLAACNYLPGNIMQFSSIASVNGTTSPALIFIDDALLTKADRLQTDLFKLRYALTPIILLSTTDDEHTDYLSSLINAQDHLIKKEITLPLFRKSVQYAIDRKEITNKLQQTRDDYMAMFHRNPLPMWVYDIQTKAFVAVNEAAVFYYGYTEQEFLSMTIMDIRPLGDIPALLAITKQTYKSGFYDLNHWTHLKKNGESVKVHIYSHNIEFEGKECKIVTAVNVDREYRMHTMLKQHGISFE
jgi:PAS domain S-box-containing protein